MAGFVELEEDHGQLDCKIIANQISDHEDI